jgi:type IV pilus assembly protein PilE
MHSLTPLGDTRILQVTRSRGFTAVEFLIVFTIVAILAAVAYPSFTKSIAKGRRADAKSSLLDLANRMEQYYAQNNTFATATIAAGNTSTDVLSGATTSQGYYTLSITAQAASTYSIKATRAGVQASDSCGDFTLTSAGVKGLLSNTSGYTVALCW